MRTKNDLVTGVDPAVEQLRNASQQMRANAARYGITEDDATRAITAAGSA